MPNQVFSFFLCVSSNSEGSDGSAGEKREDHSNIQDVDVGATLTKCILCILKCAI